MMTRSATLHNSGDRYLAGATSVRSMIFSTTLSSIGFCSRSCASACCSTSTRAACQADQWPDTRAHNESAETYATLLRRPKMIETGIIPIQKIVSQPLTRRMNTGSPWTEAHSDLIVAIRGSYPFGSQRKQAPPSQLAAPYIKEPGVVNTSPVSSQVFSPDKIIGHP